MLSRSVILSNVLLGLGLLPACAPDQTGSNGLQGNRVSETTLATFNADSCIKNDESVVCSKAFSPSKACSVAAGTEVRITNLRAPSGYRIGAKEHVFAARVVLVQPAYDGSRANNPCTASSLSALTEQAGATDQDDPLKDLPLRIWAPHLKLQPGTAIQPLPELRLELAWPTDGVFTSPFGWRWGRMHNGIDIANKSGTPIRAAASGLVALTSYNDGGWGHFAAIGHLGRQYETLYGHFESPPSVPMGSRVQKGTQIGRMGSTGRSTGPHLHFESCKGDCYGKKFNPLTAINILDTLGGKVTGALGYLKQLGDNVLPGVWNWLRGGSLGDVSQESSPSKPEDPSSNWIATEPEEAPSDWSDRLAM